MALTLWLVRHGETASNAEGVFQGHLDVELNDRGRQQAARVHTALTGIAFDAVYASDLQRAAATAEIIVNGQRDVILDPDLREMHYGVLQGVRYQDAASALEEHGMADEWRSGSLQRRGTAMPGGEGLRAVRNRSTRFLRQVEQRFPVCEDHQVLVVAHGGKLSVLLTVLLGIPGHHRHAFRFANCGLTRVTRTPGRTTLDLHNVVLWDDSLPGRSAGPTAFGE